VNGLIFVEGFVIRKGRSNFLILLFLIMVLLLIWGCPSGPSDPTLKVIEVAFSDTWDKENNDIGTPATQFPSGTDTVYYRIKFEEQFLENLMLRKKWTRNQSDFLTTVCFMPQETVRICGEIHYYISGTNLESGDYKISVYYFKDGEYFEVGYGSGVNKTFTIQ